MKLYVEWSRPIQLKDASKENMIYGIDLSKVSAGTGVYIFGRRWGSQFESLYVGKARNVRSRVKGHLNRNFHFELPLHPKTYASYPVVSIANRPGLFEVVVRHILAVLRSRCAGFACPACLAADTCPARPLLST